MTDPAIPPEADEPSGRSTASLPETAPNPSKADPDQDPSDAGTTDGAALPPLG